MTTAGSRRTVQEQIGASLTAIGQILNLKIVEPNAEITLDNEKLQKLADAANLFVSTHHAISVRRKFEIQPFINEDSKTAAQASKIDELLFEKGFMEKLQSYKTVRKAANEIKKLIKVTRVSSTPGPSNQQPQYLNYKRLQFKKGKRETRHSPTRDQANHGKSRRAREDLDRTYQRGRARTSKQNK
ncbi:hypothetical protein NQ315_006070 [Exocentrus adspersus]|uniref:Uncharacterized protein n=1 Tax=Exocentrus adspersus TaxID=1586481 RepID=A0AAV8VGF6_9CUCU|nr:hypothetical protein NQ315_006070 [Exocentrus adspersus]